MTILDDLELKVSAIRPRLEALCTRIDFTRSETPRPNHSAHLVIESGDRALDLLVWESGEADYAEMKEPGEVVWTHFEGLTDDNLDELLARMHSLIESWAEDVAT